MFSLNPQKVNFDEEIGKGAHGMVYAYQQKHEDDDKYVVKRIATPQIDIMILTVQEIVLGFSCDHPHVLTIKGYHLSYDKSTRLWDIFIKMPRMETSSLKTRIMEYARQGKVFKEEEIVRYFYSLTLGLRYLHSKQIAHRDVKPDNILIDKTGNLKIADVGIAKLIDDDGTELLTGASGVPQYIAPEILRLLTHPSELKLKKRDLFLADIWSLGVIMAELCVPKIRLINTQATGQANESMLTQILRGLQNRYSKTLLDLILSLLRAEPSERKSLDEVQRVLEETYPHILKQDPSNKDREDKVEEENKILKSKLSDLERQIQDLQKQVETLRLLAREKEKDKKKLFSNSQDLPPLANPSLKREEEKKFEEKEPKTGLFKGSCLNILEGHASPVVCFTLATQKILASGSEDGLIKFWDTETGICTKTLHGHTKSVKCLQSLLSGELVSCSDDMTIRVWNIKTGECFKILSDHTGDVNCLELLPEDQLASGSWDKTIKIWNTKTYSCVKSWKGNQGAVHCLKYLPTRNQLASSHSKNVVQLWDIETGACLRTLTGHKNNVLCLQLLPSGALASGSNDKTIKIWDLDTGTCLKTLEGFTNSIRNFELFSVDEFVACSWDGSIKILDIKSGVCVKSLKVHTSVLCLKLLPTGKLASGLRDKTIQLWN